MCHLGFECNKKVKLKVTIKKVFGKIIKTNPPSKMYFIYFFKVIHVNNVKKS